VEGSHCPRCRLALALRLAPAFGLGLTGCRVFVRCPDHDVAVPDSVLAVRQRDCGFVRFQADTVVDEDGKPVHENCYVKETTGHDAAADVAKILLTRRPV
jgi:hypothetical protein